MLHARSTRAASLLPLGALALACLTGFAPFKSEGLAIFRIANGQGALSEDGLLWRQVEAPALAHTLSSRFGGGGALFYMEYTPDASGVSGLLLIDLRHAGLPDLDSSLITLPDRRRVEVYYQEWDATGDVFLSSRSEGEVLILDIFRGERVSAASVSFDLTFLSEGGDGVIGTGDDVWRRVEGRATTSPTVDEAVEIEADLVFDRRSTTEPYAPDGDITINCYGDTTIEEEAYDDESYIYEDNEGGGCEGDTWEDDAVDPQESGGCAGETVVDDGEPNTDAGCEASDEFEDPDEEQEEEDSFYEDDSYEDDSGCEGDTTDDTTSTTDDSTTDDSTTDTSDDTGEGGCESDTEAALPPGQQARLREELTRDPRARAGRLDDRPRHRFARKTRERLRRVFNYTPFFLLGCVIHLWRRRLQREPSLGGGLGG